MIRILMSDYSMNGLEDFIKEEMKVTVVPYANYVHLEDINNFNKLFNSTDGTEFLDIFKAYNQYGIKKENICVIDPHRDSKTIICDKLSQSDIIFLSGGDPVMFMYTCPQWVQSIIKRYDGIIMGASAGAMVQQEKFYMYDGVDDFHGYCYYKGLGLAKGYNLMVHYNDTIEQLRGIERNTEEPIIRLRDGVNIVLVD